MVLCMRLWETITEFVGIINFIHFLLVIFLIVLFCLFFLFSQLVCYLTMCIDLLN